MSAQEADLGKRKYTPTPTMERFVNSMPIIARLRFRIADVIAGPFIDRIAYKLSDEYYNGKISLKKRTIQ